MKKTKSKPENAPQEKAGGDCPRTPCSESSGLDDGWEERLIEYRKKHFAVEVTSARGQKRGEICLSVTANGNQWHSITLMPDEIQRVIDALQNSLPNVPVVAPATLEPESKNDVVAG